MEIQYQLTWEDYYKSQKLHLRLPRYLTVIYLIIAGVLFVFMFQMIYQVYMNYQFKD